jgi:hypothetical protein
MGYFGRSLIPGPGQDLDCPTGTESPTENKRQSKKLSNHIARHAAMNFSRAIGVKYMYFVRIGVFARLFFGKMRERLHPSEMQTISGKAGTFFAGGKQTQEAKDRG